MTLGTQHIIQKVKRHKRKLVALVVLFLLWLFCLPSELFKDPTSTVVESREGIMLGARIAEDSQWRFPEMDSVPSRFEQCILHFEDEYFYSHPGFNPVSMGKALWQNLTTDKRRGGSTLTQQVIRLSRKNKKRTYFEKGIEIVMATRLEAGFSKEEILSLYASHAPFGGNVVGLETASWRYFGLPSSELSWGQSAALAILPNAPSLIFPGKNEAILKQKRDSLLKKLLDKGIIDETTYELALAEALPGKPYPLPDIAFHLTERLKKEYPGERKVSTISYELQNKLNRIVSRHHFELKQNGIHNMAVLVLDVDTREVLGYVGNAPTTSENNKYVDIINKSRSTGSVLKPFLFASMLNSGELLPNTLVADVPTVINGYNPENFDGEFNGAVPASVALSRSLNIPAVRMLRSYGLERFHKRLKELDFKGIDKPSSQYGLSLILGGAESSLWEVTNAYAGMAATLNYFNRTSSEYNQNSLRSPLMVNGKNPTPNKREQDPIVFDAGAIFKTLDALQQVNRPAGEENWSFFSNSQPIAWKTGTSFGFKDAWAVGVTPKYAIGVWVGNADGEGRPGLTGIQAAAPALFSVLDVLPKSRWFDIPYDELTEAELCATSGHLAGVHCDDIVTEFIPVKGIRTTPCTYHQRVFLDASETFQVNSSCYSLAEMKQQQRFVLPPTIEYYYSKKHPEYVPLPPFRNDCLRDGEQLMEFIYPKPNEAILLAKDFDENINDIIFKVAHRNEDSKLYWYLDESFIGVTEIFHEIAVQPVPGEYMLTVVDQEGNQLKQRLVITKPTT
ncbi:penicillin-binding protein 1C [Aureitalea sp. L0-47]|uniref:penicillin-binding protein 1C n=1 Tax=Aureitalea sp. L0-47 TaxID=2816962 RepID=UPI002237C73B|nr:penicillin-binding protein 1C [Aureitalea sp. L0-47]MCW5520917.1 penicillin-binding protein 1C [Aureitalea sp. L0-47]